jgi:3-oxoacyl-[acyl-carrier protein] reductase
MNVQNKTVVITGAAQGLGRAMALELAERGAQIAAVDLNLEKLKATVAACEALGVKAKAYTANISNEEQVCTLFNAIDEDFSGIDVLVNNAGIVRDGFLVKYKDGEYVSKMSLDDFNAVIQVNLAGVFLCGREAACKMINRQSGGVIVNISSISRSGNIGQTNYTAAKAGVAGMTVTWAKELARYGIRVAAIAPGFIETEMTAGMKPEALLKVCQTIPLNRLGKPQEIASSVRFIIENDYFTGRIIECDGGLRL